VTRPSGTPMLAPAPGTTPGPGANTGRSRTGPSFRRLDLTAAVLQRAGNGYDAWLDHIWPAAACTSPIRLHGLIHHVDSATGEIVRTASTDAMPDQVIYKPCGNRRDRACPGCAETYRRDAFQLIRAGLAGGKGIPAAVATHPAIFATFTAPSFGPVHARPIRHHICAGKTSCRCKPEPCHARRDAETCPHGRAIACWRRHSPNDPLLGQPLCTDCYDYPAHVVWNNSAGELWRRTKQDIERHLAALARRRGISFHPIPCGDGKVLLVPPIRLSHGKAAEYQARGAVHFHVLLRLDGVDPADPDRVIPPPVGISAADLEHAIRATARTITYRTGVHKVNPAGWVIGWGTELDIRIIAIRGIRAVTDLAVASYLAKYSTKGTEPAGHASARITPATISLYAHADGTHPERLIHACWTLGTHPDYIGLRRWAHMLGFGGHFLTKARRYSITLTALRQARITYRRHQDTGPEHRSPDSNDSDSETTLVLNWLSYTGTGWHTTADALLANTAADQARKRRQVGREELACEYNSTTAGGKAA
jgi:hypothetical protein